jgi:hypothetical protein
MQRMTSAEDIDEKLLLRDREAALLTGIKYVSEQIIELKTDILKTQDPEEKRSLQEVLGSKHRELGLLHEAYCRVVTATGKSSHWNCARFSIFACMGVWARGGFQK